MRYFVADFYDFLNNISGGKNLQHPEPQVTFWLWFSIPYKIQNAWRRSFQLCFPHRG